MKLERFPEVFERLLFTLALAGDINVKALRNIPLSFAPDGRGEWSLHKLIFSQK